MSWRDQLQPASFRGVPFQIEDSDVAMGRRLVTNEYPGSDDSYTENLGRKARHYRIKGYIIGDDYMDGRDRMIAACENFTSSGTLVHPWLGQLNVHCGELTLREEKTAGGMVVLSFTFVEADWKIVSPAPTAKSDTSGNVLGLTPATFNLLKTAFTVAFSVNNLGALAAGFGVSILGDVAGRILGLAGIPTSYLGSVSALVSQMFANPGVSATDPETAAGNICGALSAYGAAVVAYQQDLASGTVAPSFSSTSVSIQNDPTGGLADFAAQFASDYATLPPPVTPDRVEEGVNQQAVVDLVNGAVAVTVAEIFAQSDFDSADAADAARDQLIALFDTPVERAADADADDLYGGLIECRAAALADIATRGSALLPLLTWTTGRPRTAIGLAMTLYPDFGARDSQPVDGSIESAASDLIVRNASVHPAFMPVSGTALAA